MALTEASVLEHLVARGLMAPGESSTVTVLSGGVSSDVLKVQLPGRVLVVKQPLPQLRVAQTWLADPRRATAEAAALTLLRPLDPEVLPELLDLDEDNHILVMTSAPAEWATWKQQLLASDVRQETAERLGLVLGTWHAGTQDPTALPKRLTSLKGFHEQRLSPFYGALRERYPERRPQIEAAVHQLMTDRRCLVHGDFSPKNVLVGSEGLWVLDFEIAHYGNPAFDLAFLTCHLLLKAAHLPELMPQLQTAAQGFLKTYRQTAPGTWNQQGLLPQLGCLLLARVDGKSPAGYLTPGQEDIIRAVGFALLDEQIDSLAAAFVAVGTG